MKLFLIGLPGCGKSTAGRKLANSLGVDFVDLDDEIVKITRQEISETFEQFGEEYFRERETEALRTVIKNEQDMIVSCGGGAPCFHDNLKLMKSAGQVIFLDVSIEEIVKRLTNDTGRPLLANGDQKLRLNQLYAERIQYYQQADHIIKNDGDPLKDLRLLVP
ncbi:MAG: shikimate kinase [Cyclobacteriaceae bacterium]